MLTIKKIFLLIIVLMTGFFAAQGQSMLRVSLRDHATQISVSVDGRYFSRRGTSVTVGELPYGRHSLKVYAVGYTRRGRGVEEVIYSGSIKTYNGMISLVVVDPLAGTRSVREVDIDEYMASHPMSARGKFMGSKPDGKDLQGYGSSSDNNGGQPDNNRPAANVANTTEARPVTSPTSASKPGTLTQSRMVLMKKKAAEKTNDTQKMIVLKDELNKEKITTAQVAEVMDWFTFESSKVEFAKWAYTITTDKEYFGSLKDKLAYQNSQEELNTFISEQK